MGRRVLIVASTYAPAMMADMHRARLLAWELPALGWDVEVLCPDATYQVAASVDADSGGFFCPDTPIHYVGQAYGEFFRLVRMRSIGWRALAAMNGVAAQLFAQRHFDMVYFSTTQFSLFLLGPLWRRRYGVPYALDFHDPCYRDEPGFHGGVQPGIRRWVGRRLSKAVEATATSSAAGLVSVSPRYIETLRDRYGAKHPSWLRHGCNAVIPFAGSGRDLEEAARTLRPCGDLRHAKSRVVYAGAGGPIMERAFGVLCRGLAELKRRKCALLDRVEIVLYGTMLHWREGDRRHLHEVAKSNGVETLVREEPGRVSYRRSLELLLGAQGALVLGVEDAGYVPSKLVTYALSGKPLLTVLNARSPARALLRDMSDSTHSVWFGDDEPGAQETAAVVERYLEQVVSGASYDRLSLLASGLAREMAVRHAGLFEQCMTT